MLNEKVYGTKGSTIRKRHNSLIKSLLRLKDTTN